MGDNWPGVGVYDRAGGGKEGVCTLFCETAGGRRGFCGIYEKGVYCTIGIVWGRIVVLRRWKQRWECVHDSLFSLVFLAITSPWRVRLFEDILLVAFPTRQGQACKVTLLFGST